MQNNNHSNLVNYSSLDGTLKEFSGIGILEPFKIISTSSDYCCFSLIQYPQSEFVN